MVRPDPGRDIQERLLAAMSPNERFAIVTRLRARGRALIWQQADAAGPMGELERARFILMRLYPEMPARHLEQVLARLAEEEVAGRWNGFEPLVATTGEEGRA